MNDSDRTTPAANAMGQVPAQLLHLMAVRYISVGTLGALIWNLLSNLAFDYGLVFGGRRFSIASAAYLCSRLSTLAFVLGGTIYSTAELGPNCINYERGFSWAYPVAVSSTTFLFFLRVRAVYNGTKPLVYFFFLLWLAVIGSTATSIKSIVGMNIEDTGYCTAFASSENFASVASIVPLIYDTLIFLAITFKLASYSVEPTNETKTHTKIKFRSLVFGDYLPRLSRSLLKDGQLYYLTTVTTNLAALSLLYAPVAPEYRVMGAVPNLVITNIMACAAHRKLRYHFDKSDNTSSLPLSTFEARRGPGPESSPTSVWPNHDRPTLNTGVTGLVTSVDVSMHSPTYNISFGEQPLQETRTASKSAAGTSESEFVKS